MVDSKSMGPIDKELSPFNDGDGAEKFKNTNEGMIKQFADISIEDIKKLGMGGMKMQGKMKGKM